MVLHHPRCCLLDRRLDLAVAGTGSLGFSAITQISIGEIWAMSFGRSSFDLFGVFFERKITVFLFDYPVGGEQLYWWWLRPGFEQPPVTWLALGVAWLAAFFAVGYVLNLAKRALDDSEE